MHFDAKTLFIFGAFVMYALKIFDMQYILRGKGEQLLFQIDLSYLLVKKIQNMYM